MYGCNTSAYTPDSMLQNACHISGMITLFVTAIAKVQIEAGASYQPKRVLQLVLVVLSLQPYTLQGVTCTAVWVTSWRTVVHYPWVEKAARPFFGGQEARSCFFVHPKGTLSCFLGGYKAKSVVSRVHVLQRSFMVVPSCTGTVAAACALLVRCLSTDW